MFNVLTLNKISKIGLSRLGDNYNIADDVQNPDAVLVRSAAMHDMELPESLLAIARAGAGVNNIPLDKCSEKGIVVFNTPGANANAVKELVLTGLLLSSRKVVDGIAWAKTLKGNGDAVGKMVEKGKSQFVGPEIMGKTLGVVGLGAIGILVANAAAALGMDVIGYDPFLSVDAAWSLNREVKHAETLDALFAKSDYITVHVPLSNQTRGMIDQEAISKMKEGVVILNFARDGLVNEDAIVGALEQGKVKKYVTDFVTPRVAKTRNTLVTPHLGASTAESEDNCAEMAVKELMNYLQNGNIKNSVNYPECDMGVCNSEGRIAINHRNIPNMIAQLTKVLGDEGINITVFSNKSSDSCEAPSSLV